MKRILLSFCLLAGLGAAQAQLNNVACPSFSGTDTEGNTWDIDDLMDDGYTIILDVFATWCGPCWSYAGTGALDKVWEELGPEGADKVIVLSIEADPSTNAADLAGTTGGTVGNWNELIHNPIIDNASIGSILSVAGYPTIYRVCPNDRKIYYMNQPGYQAMYDAIMDADCSVASDAVDGFLGGVEGALEVCGSDVAVQVTNLGSNDLTAFDIEVNALGSIQSTTPWTGTLASFESASVVVPAPFVAGSDDVSFRIVAAGDAKTGNDTYLTTMRPAPANTSMDFELEIQADQYGYEIYWQLEDESGTVVASGGNAAVGINGGGAQSITSGGYGPNSLNIEPITVPGPGCYSLVMVDDWGDGICCGYGDGYYRLKDGDGNTMVEGGGFGPYGYNNVRQGMASGIDGLPAVGSMNLFPNPASSAVYLQVEGVEALHANILITNAIGQVVEMRAEQQFVVGTNAFTFDVSELPAGLYNATITNNNGQRTVSFSVAH